MIASGWLRIAARSYWPVGEARATMLPAWRLASDAEAEQLDVAAAGFGLARRSGFAFHGNEGLLVLLAFALRLIVAGDHHRPIGAFAAGVFRARYPDAGSVVQQQVLAMPGRVDPLSQGLLEIVVAVGDVLGGAACAGRCDPAVERAEGVVTEGVLRRHRARLVHGDAVEGRIADDADLTMLEAEARDQLGGGLGHCGRGGEQQKASDQAANHTMHHRPPSAHAPAKSPRQARIIGSLLYRQCGRFKA